MSLRTGYGDAACDRFTVRYKLPGGSWQATRVLLSSRPHAEEDAEKYRNELQAAGHEAEVIRWTPC